MRAAKSKPAKFATLVSKDSNHAYVLRRCLRTHNFELAEIELYMDFLLAFEDLIAGKIDFILQASVRPQHSECAARYLNRAFVVDTFVAASKPLAIISRKDITTPKSIGLQPATRHYTDLSGWPEQIEEPSTSAVTEGLLIGRYDSGLTALEFVRRAPGRFRLDREIGPVKDAWILFGREPASRSDYHFD